MAGLADWLSAASGNPINHFANQQEGTYRAAQTEGAIQTARLKQSEALLKDFALTQSQDLAKYGVPGVDGVRGATIQAFAGLGNPDQITQAAGNVQLQGFRDTVASPLSDWGTSQRALAAIDGKPVVALHGVGAGGVTNIMADPTSAGALKTTPLGDAMIGADEARAVASRSTAALNNTKRAATTATDGNEGYSADAIALAARQVLVNPAAVNNYASRGKEGTAIRQAVFNEAQRLKNATGLTDSDVMQIAARAKAAVGVAGTTAKQLSLTDAYEKLARENGQRVLELIDMVDDTGIPLIEGITRSAKAKAGNVNAAELRSVMSTFQAEAARLLTASPTMAGVVSNQARTEVKEMAPDSMTAAQARRVINRLFTEMDIRRDAIGGQLNTALAQQDLPGSTSTVATVTPVRASTAPTAVAAPAALPKVSDGTQAPAGWTLKTDKNGAQAYVSPDGKQFFEIAQ